LVRLALRTVLRSGKDVEIMDDKKEVRAEGERRFQKEGPITEKDLKWPWLSYSPRDKELPPIQGA